MELLSAVQKAGSQKYELTAANRPAFHVKRGKVSDLKIRLCLTYLIVFAGKYTYNS